MDENFELAALEAARQLKNLPDKQAGQEDYTPKRLGSGFLLVMLLAFFVDVVEIIGTVTGAGIPFVWIGGFVIDSIVYGSLGASGKLKNQWGKAISGLVGENLPILSSFLEFIPVRTFSLFLIYRSTNKSAST